MLTVGGIIGDLNWGRHLSLVFRAGLVPATPEFSSSLVA